MLNHIWTICLFQLSRALKSKRGWFFLLLFNTILLAGLAIFFEVYDEIYTQAKHLGVKSLQPTEIEELKHRIFATGGASEQMVEYLLQIPLGVLLIFFLSTMVLPLFVLLLSHNQVSQDIRDKGIRYLLLRTSRLTLILGKFAGEFLLLGAITLTGYFASLLYILYKADIFPIGDYSLFLLSLFKFWLLTLIYGGCFTSLTLLFSCLVKKKFSVMALGFISIFVLWILESNESWQILSPFRYKTDFYSQEIGTVCIAAAILIIFTAVFISLSYFIFSKRDV